MSLSYNEMLGYVILGYGSLVQYMYSSCIVLYPIFAHLLGVVIPSSLGPST